VKRIVVCSLFLILFVFGLSLSTQSWDCSRFPNTPWEFNCFCGGESQHCILFYSRMCACGYEWVPNSCNVELKDCTGETIAEIVCGIYI
jgi:hypothetical protein